MRLADIWVETFLSVEWKLKIKIDEPRLVQLLEKMKYDFQLIN